MQKNNFAEEYLSNYIAIDKETKSEILSRNSLDKIFEALRKEEITIKGRRSIYFRGLSSEDRRLKTMTSETYKKLKAKENENTNKRNSNNST